jgi:hypothetical protein
MSIHRIKAIALSLLLTAGGSAALAQGIPQDPISKAAVGIQQEAAQGRISSKQAGQIEGRLWQLKSEEQQDMARHGGYLTPQDNHQLWSEIHSIEAGNDFDGKNWHSSPHRSQLTNSFANQGGYPPPGYNGGYNNGYNPGYNGAYNNPGYPNGYNGQPVQSGSKFSQAASLLGNFLHH